MNHYSSEYAESEDQDDYDTADDEDLTDNESDRRHRSRSRVDHLRSSSSRERPRQSPERRRHRSRRRHGRHGRRHRQRNHRNERAQRDESWYFPDERTDEAAQIDPESHEDLISANNSWVQALENRQPVQVSPLVQGNRNHTMAWRNNNRTITLTTNQDGRQRMDVGNNVQQPMGQDALNVNRAARQDRRLPNDSHPDVNFNLAQELQDRTRAMEQLNNAASQIRVAAAAAAASYAQLIASQPNRQHNSQQHAAVQSLNTWENRVRQRDSWLDISISETGHHPAANGNGRIATRRHPQSSTERNNYFRPISPLAQRPIDEQSRNPVRVASDVEDPISNSTSALNRNSRGNTTSGSTAVAQTSDSAEQVLVQPYHVLTDSDNDPFTRYDAAYRRQEERNDWRQRRRQRRDRQQRREMEGRIHQRRRPQPNPNLSSSTSSDRSVNLPVPALQPAPIAYGPDPQAPIALLPEPIIPVPPPLPPLNWEPPPAQNNEWPDAPNYVSIDPSALQQNGQQRHGDDNLEPPQQRENHSHNDSDDDDMDDDDTYSEMTEYMLRSYQDPAEGNTGLGEFLRRITARGRVVVSRVRTRITKQYFRRGDFQIALADFRSLHPEHARQVPGVGFTGTINNMYRLTVKQNSTFGKPTFEIRPMNRKVRRKKLHVCYKIRYFGHRGNRTGRGRARAPVVV